MNVGSQNAKRMIQFATSVVGQNLALKLHDSKSGNMYAKKYIEAAELLLSGGPEAVESFALLLDAPWHDVKVMAATYLLPHKTEEALPILQQAAKGKGIAAMGAYMTLKRWKDDQRRILVNSTRQP
jgi:hypothetical protein